MTPTAQLVLESEYHSGEPCDCYPPDRDRPDRECVVWGNEILYALARAGYVVARRDGSQPADALAAEERGRLSSAAEKPRTEEP